MAFLGRDSRAILADGNGVMQTKTPSTVRICWRDRKLEPFLNCWPPTLHLYPKHFATRNAMLLGPSVRVRSPHKALAPIGCTDDSGKTTSKMPRAGNNAGEDAKDLQGMQRPGRNADGERQGDLSSWSYTLRHRAAGTPEKWRRLTSANLNPCCIRIAPTLRSYRPTKSRGRFHFTWPRRTNRLTLPFTCKKCGLAAALPVHQRPNRSLAAVRD